MIPIKLHMINFGPYEDSTISFNFKSALITGENANVSGASNGTGKSTIFQALTWVLTGNSRYKNSNSIIRDGSDSAKVTLTFKSGNDVYQIIRGRNRTNKQTLDFNKILKDGKIDPVKADTNSKLDDKIAEITKIKYDSFVNTAYFAQNTISEFMYGTSSVRQKLIAEILAMDRWNAYAKNAAAKLTEAEKDLDVARYKASVFGNLEKKYKESTEELEALSNKLKQSTDTITRLESQVVGLLALAANESAAVQARLARDSAERLVEGLKRNTKTLSERKATLSKEIDNVTKQLSLLSATVEDIGPRPDGSHVIVQRLAERRGDLAVTQKRLYAMERGNCDTCGSSWNSDHSNEMTELRKTIDELKNRISVGEKKLTESKNEETAWDLKNAKQVEIKNKISNYKLRSDSLGTDLASLLEDERLAQIELSSAEAKLAAIPIPDTVSTGAAEQVKELQSKLNIARLNNSSIVASHAQVKARLDVIIAQMDESKSINARCAEIEKEINLYSALSKHFSKTGIQASILDNVIAEIETLSNSFLMRLSHKPFSIRFITQKQDTKGQLKETLDIEVISPNSVKYIEDLSGGEQFRVGFSIRLALATVQARRQGGDLTMLLLDEVSSSLDKVGIETFVSIVKELQKTMIIMLITHDDSLKEHFDNVIKVRNNGQIAKIIQ